MGNKRLEGRLDAKDFDRWVKRSGFRNELDFWSGLSGLNKGTLTDHMVKYLSSLGYRGTPDDMLSTFLSDQVGLIGGHVGTLYDKADRFYNGVYTASVASIASTPNVGRYTKQFINYEGFLTAGYYQ